MKTIQLDITNKTVIPLLYVKQGDVGAKINVQLTDEGKAYQIPAGAVFSVWYSGASGEGNYTTIDGRSAFSVSGNKVTAELIMQMLQNKGSGQLCLVMNKGDGSQLGLWNIPYCVEEIPGEGSGEAKAYYTAFSEAVKDLPYPDVSLSVPNKAADSKAVGDALETKAGLYKTVTGNDITIENAPESVLRGLKLYGWSRQDGTPSPDNPVEIVSAGAKGSITVNIDGDTPQTLTALTPNGLPGFKVSGGGTHTDSTGQQWICDEIDFIRGVRVQRLMLVNLGDYNYLDDWNKYYNIDGTFLGRCNFDDGVKYLGGRLCKVSHLSYSKNTLTSSENGFDCGQGNGKALAIRVSTSIASTKEELKAWLADNNVQFLYRLENPIETPLTKEEMLQYATLRTVSPSTHVTNSDSVDMEVSYYLPRPALPVSGGTMGGEINMGNHRITGLRWPVAPTDAVSLEALQRSRDFEWEDVDNVTFNGWYLYSSHEEASKRITIDGYTFGYAYMFVERWNEESLRQTLYPVSATGYSLVRTRTVSGWTPWEWVNPPMIVDIEYRTTERWQGKPVYTKLINFGTLPNNSQKVVSAKLYSTASNMLRVSGTRSDGESLPLWFRDGSVDKTVTLYSSRDNIVIRTNYDCSTLTAYVQLWYVK